MSPLQAERIWDQLQKAERILKTVRKSLRGDMKGKPRQKRPSKGKWRLYELCVAMRRAADTKLSFKKMHEMLLAEGKSPPKTASSLQVYFYQCEKWSEKYGRPTDL